VIGLRHSTAFWGVILFLVITIAIVLLGYYIMADKDFRYSLRVPQVVDLISRVYPESFDTSRMMSYARREVFARLDRYSGYLEPEELDRIAEDFSGSYGGIGITVIGHERGLQIVSVRENAPAGRAGIRIGDIIIQVDTVGLAGVGPYRSSYHLRGKEGTPVTVFICRPPWHDTLDFNLTRERLKFIHIPYAGLTGREVLYIRILDFEAGLYEELLDVLDSAYLPRKDSIKALIIDLRGNPGGLLNETARACDLFLDEGHLIVGVKGKSRWRSFEHFSSRGDMTDGLPIAVLVDKASASAAEIFAGCLKYSNRAVLVGDTTFGKGLVQEYQALGDGSGMRLTTSRYYFEGGIFLNPSIEEPDSSAGVPPDHFIKAMEMESFPSFLEGFGYLRDFALNNKEKILSISPFEENLPEWVDGFVEYIGEKGFQYESELTKVAIDIKNMTSDWNSRSSVSSAIDRIVKQSKAEDSAQTDNYRDYIARRLYQISIEMEYGISSAYREVVVPYRPEIRLAERVLMESK